MLGIGTVNVQLHHRVLVHQGTHANADGLSMLPLPLSPVEGSEQPSNGECVCSVPDASTSCVGGSAEMSCPERPVVELGVQVCTVGFA